MKDWCVPNDHAVVYHDCEKCITNSQKLVEKGLYKVPPNIKDCRAKHIIQK
jgi:hypothetical protein